MTTEKPLYYENAKSRFAHTKTAMLVTYDSFTGWPRDERECEISSEHDFSKGPYQDTVGFAVGSNQDIEEVK